MSCKDREICFRKIRDWTKTIPNVGIYTSTRDAVKEILTDTRKRDINIGERLGMSDEWINELIALILRDANTLTYECKYELFEPYKILFLFVVVFVVVSNVLDISTPEVARYIPAYAGQHSRRYPRFYFDQAALNDIIRAAEIIRTSGCSLKSVTTIKKWKEAKRVEEDRQRQEERMRKRLQIRVDSPRGDGTPTSVASSVTTSPHSPYTGRVVVGRRTFYDPQGPSDTNRLRRFRKVSKLKIGDVIIVRRKGRTVSAVVTDTKRRRGIPVCFSNQTCWFATDDCIIRKSNRNYKWTKSARKFLEESGILGKRVLGKLCSW